MKPNITLMTAKTLPQVHAIFKDSITECWSKQALTEELQNPQARVLVQLDGETVQGFCQLRHVAGEGELLNIAVASHARRQGVGKALMAQLQELATKEHIDCYFLEVRSQNSQAIAFYQKLGWQQVGERRGFYQNPPDDALLYRLDFTPNGDGS